MSSCHSPSPYVHTYNLAATICTKIHIPSPKSLALVRVGHGAQAGSHTDTTACACQCCSDVPLMLLNHLLCSHLIVDDCCESI